METTVIDSVSDSLDSISGELLDSDGLAHDHPVFENHLVVATEVEVTENKPGLKADAQQSEHILNAWKKYREFEEFRHTTKALDVEQVDYDSSSSEAFVREFERLAAAAITAGFVYTDTMLAFKLLEKSLMLDETDIAQFITSIPSKMLYKTNQPENGDLGSNLNNPKLLCDRWNGEVLLSLAKTYVTDLASSGEVPDSMDDDLHQDDDEPCELVDDKGILNLELQMHDQHQNAITDIKGDPANLDRILSDLQHELDKNSEQLLVEDGDDSNDLDGVEAKPLLKTGRRGRPPLKRKHALLENAQEEDTKPAMKKKRGRKPLGAESEGGLRKCNKCPFETTLKQQFILHKKNVHGRRTQECSKCSQIFLTKKGLAKHVKEMHRGNKYRCEECGTKFANNFFLTRHVESIHKGVTYSCEHCDEKFSYEHLLLQHKVKVHNMPEKTDCEDCNKTFKSNKGLRDHMKLVHGSQYPCDQCGKVFRSLPSIKIHQRITHDGIRFPCNECDKQFRFAHEVTKHKKIMHSENPLDVSQVCDTCGQRVRNKDALSQHRRKVHDFRKYYSCSQCDYAGKDTDSLKAHVILKHEGRKLKCNQCDFEATSLNGLYEHRSLHKAKKKADPNNIHKLEATMTCEKCGYVAKNRTDLGRHNNRIHENRYTCQQCDHMAQNATALRFHILNKHEGVTFPCDICDFQASHPKYLKRHKEALHENKRYYCNLCDYSAKDNGMVTKHKLAKHEGVQFPCDLCEMKFATQTSLRKHKKIKHFDVPIVKCE